MFGLKKTEALAVTFLLLLVGLSSIVISFQTVTKFNLVKSFDRVGTWSVSGSFDAKELLTFMIFPDSQWSLMVPSEEEYPVVINMSVLAPDGGIANLSSIYTVTYVQSGLLPSIVLSPVNFSIVEVNTTCLGFSSLYTTDEVAGVLFIGDVKVGGNFTVVVDETSIKENFYPSERPPRKLTLRGYVRDVEYPGILFLPVGCVFVFLSIVVLWYGFRHKKVDKRRKVKSASFTRAFCVSGIEKRTETIFRKN